MNENIKTSVHKYYNAKVPILSHWSTARNKAATLSPEEYEFLYEIATTNPVYSKKAELLRNALHHYQDRKSINSPLPLIFKQAVYLLAYELCRGDYYDVAQKKALEDVGLAHNSFSKWKMKPKEDYILNQRTPLSMPIPYQGKKNYALVHLVNELSKQVNYKTFVDVFCGSGTVTLGIQKHPKCNYYMNDINPARTNLINVLRDNNKEFLQYLSELMELIKDFTDGNIPDLTASFLPIFPEISNWKIIALKIIRQILAIRTDRREREIPKNIADIDLAIPDITLADISIANIEHYISITRIEKYIAEPSVNIQLVFAEGISVFFNKIAKDISNDPLAYAIATVYTDTFDSRRKPSKNRLETFYSTLPYWSKVIKEFQGFKIITLKQSDHIVVEQFKNDKDTLLYLDSPYIGTAGYSGSPYKLKHFERLRDKLKKFNGKWIFSCRVNVVYQNKDPNKLYHEFFSDTNERRAKRIQRKVANIRSLLDMYKSLALNVAFIRPNSEFNDESFLTESAEEKEVMFFNFNATAPDIQKFYNHICKKINKDNDEIGCESDSVCSIMSYEKFYSLAQSGLDHVDGTCC